MWLCAVVVAFALCIAHCSANITRAAIPEEASDWRSDFFRKNPNISLESLLPIRYDDEEFLLNYDLIGDDSENLKAAWPGWLFNWGENSEGWPEVPYRIDGGLVITGGIQEAIRHWEENTCIKFRDVGDGGLYPHVVFQSNPSSCFSRIGRIFFLIKGQSILLTTACQLEVGIVVHEIGHALGLYHEQTRTGRDDYVHILWKNMQLNALYNNFPALTENYDVPYDYSSIMHYGMLEFSRNGRSVLVTKDQMAQGLLFLNEELSHMDKKLVNIQYGCIEKWAEACSVSSDACQHDGYLGADCRCVCPAGTSGDYCQQRDMTYTEALIAKHLPYNAEVTTEMTLTSPDYPTPLQNGTTYTVRITAPEGKQVSLKFNDFDLAPRCDGLRLRRFCCTNGLEMRLDGQPTSGTWYCGDEISAGQEFVSTDNVLVFFYHSINYPKYFLTSSHKGYEATVTFI